MASKQCFACKYSKERDGAFRSFPLASILLTERRHVRNVLHDTRSPVSSCPFPLIPASDVRVRRHLHLPLHSPCCDLNQVPIISHKPRDEPGARRRRLAPRHTAGRREGEISQGPESSPDLIATLKRRAGRATVTKRKAELHAEREGQVGDPNSSPDSIAMNGEPRQNERPGCLQKELVAGKGRSKVGTSQRSAPQKKCD